MKELEDIIEQMYYLETTFDEAQEIVIQALEFETNTDRFY